VKSHLLLTPFRVLCCAAGLSVRRSAPAARLFDGLIDRRVFSMPLFALKSPFSAAWIRTFYDKYMAARLIPKGWDGRRYSHIAHPLLHLSHRFIRGKPPGPDLPQTSFCRFSRRLFPLSRSYETSFSLVNNDCTKLITHS
jgi:hypothetical protein